MQRRVGHEVFFSIAAKIVGQFTKDKIENEPYEVLELMHLATAQFQGLR
jgi:hypothetical protein